MASTAATLEQWALPRLQQLLPLDDESLRQVLTYATTLSKPDAAEHLKNLLGDDARALEFIAGFNLRRGRDGDGGSSNNRNTTAGAASAGGMSTSSAQQQQQTPSTGVERTGAASGRGGREGKKKKSNIHALPARRVEGHGDVSGAYVKSRAEGDYMPRSQHHKMAVADNLALREEVTPDATQLPLITDDASLTTRPITSKAPPSAAGLLISDNLAPSSKKKPNTSTPTSRTQSPAPPRTKVTMTGGPQMRGASTALSDLDSAIRSLEMQTNPTLTATNNPEDLKRRRCNCMATRHPLLDIAPNCLRCGQIICVKQGLGPCTFCGTPLLTSEEISKVLRVLKDERGEEKQRANNAVHKRADVAQGKPRAYTGRDFLAQMSSTPASSPSARSSPLSSRPATPATDDEDEDHPRDLTVAASSAQSSSQTAAQAHRDKLLAFQAQNARRTRVHDEAADYDIPASGTNMWASPAERAAQLKRQQRVLREMEWNARPEYEKRRVVASIDLHGGRVVKRMAEVERPADLLADSLDPEEVVEERQNDDGNGGGGGSASSGGAFSRNPLAKGLIRPLARESSTNGGEQRGKEKVAVRSTKKQQWRRVQMDEDDNEAWILDGGAYGGGHSDTLTLATEEPECG